MNRKFYVIVFLGMLALPLAWLAAVSAMEKKPADVIGSGERILVSTNHEGVALEGHDPVAYFTDNKPVMGDPQLRASYKGAIYQFASEEHKAMFEADPARYAPQFGGYCGYAASVNRISPVDPAVFQITNDRLLLQHSPEAYELFNKNTRMSLASADKNWPGLVEQKGR